MSVVTAGDEHLVNVADCSVESTPRYEMILIDEVQCQIQRHAIVHERRSR